MKTRILRCFTSIMLGLILMVLLTIVVVPVAAQTAPAWDGQSRFTVLLLGMDRRPGARDTLSVRTDVIMVASVDPKTNSIGILSIPRDMHFATAGSSELVPVNTLMVIGENTQVGYGPYLLMDTLQLNLGIYIDAYVAFDFEAFITLVDAVGGVTVDVPYDIFDPTFPDMNYGIESLYFQAGTQTMDGRTALKYARTRHGDNDYRRGERQLQIVGALRDKLTNPVLLQSLINNAPDLVQQLQNNVYTDLVPEQIVFLGLAAMQVPDENIHTGAINLDYSFDFAVSTSKSVRVPDREKLAQLMTAIFGENYWQG